MKFLREEFNLIQILKIIGGIVGLILLWLIYKKIHGDIFIIYTR